MSAVLSVADVVIRYQSRDKTSHLAVDGVSFEVAQGERLVILGPSGCGKTTLLMSMAGFVEPASGSMTVNGAPVRGPGPDRAVVFQDFDQLFPWRTAAGNITHALRQTRRLQGPDAQARAQHYLELVGIGAAADRFPHQLSGGMKMRAAIARALAIKPDILFMDEPFASVDEITRTTLQRELKAACETENMTMVMVTHSIPEAVYLADRVLVLSQGPGRVMEIVDTSSVTDFDHPEFAGMVEHLRRLLESGSHLAHQTKEAS